MKSHTLEFSDAEDQLCNLSFLVSISVWVRLLVEGFPDFTGRVSSSDGSASSKTALANFIGYILKAQVLQSSVSQAGGGISQPQVQNG